jgi:hypothetical protein
MTKESSNLYSDFTKEFDEKVEDFKKLLNYLADSYYGSEDDLIRIRNLYREFVDLQIHVLNKNSTDLHPKDRSWHKAFETKECMDAEIHKRLDPFMGMFKFLIQLYEDSK